MEQAGKVGVKAQDLTVPRKWQTEKRLVGQEMRLRTQGVLMSTEWSCIVGGRKIHVGLKSVDG